jgi:hypothetical protein
MVRPLRTPAAPRPRRSVPGEHSRPTPIALAAVARGPVRVFVGEVPVGKALASVLTLASARDPLPRGGRITACVDGQRVPVAYRSGETARAVCHRLALAVERRLGDAFAVRCEAPDHGVASVHVARATNRTEATTAEAALDRLASMLGNINGVIGLGATSRVLVVYAESTDAADAVRSLLPDSSFLRWPVEVSLCG